MYFLILFQVYYHEQGQVPATRPLARYRRLPETCAGTFEVVVPDDPTTAAPTPTQDASSVLSIFSDAYTNVEGTNFNPDWGQSTVVEEVSIDGNNTLKYGNLNYQGTEFSPALDVSGKTTLHID